MSMPLDHKIRLLAGEMSDSQLMTKISEGAIARWQFNI